MRIGYLLSTESWGGLELNQVRNALWMKERGQETFVFGLTDSQTEAFCKQNNLSFIAIPKHRKYYDWRAAGNLNLLLKENQIEHVIIRDVRDMSVCVAAKKFSKNAFKLHYFMEMQLGVDKKNILHTKRFKGLDTWSCPLKWLEEQVKLRTKMDHSKIVQIPSALDTSKFKNPPSKTEAREILKLPSDKTLIGLAGRFDPQKGQLMLLKAFLALKSEKIELVFIGQPTMNEGGDYVKEIETFMKENNLSERVHLLPFRDDMEVFYSAIDAFVMGSICETVGMVTLEAMATGTIVIGSNAGGTREILNHGNLGYLFEPTNEISLQEQLENFLVNGYFVKDYELQESVAKFDLNLVLDQVIERLS